MFNPDETIAHEVWLSGITEEILNNTLKESDDKLLFHYCHFEIDKNLNIEIKDVCNRTWFNYHPDVNKRMISFNGFMIEIIKYFIKLESDFNFFKKSMLQERIIGDDHPRLRQALQCVISKWSPRYA